MLAGVGWSINSTTYFLLPAVDGLTEYPTDVVEVVMLKTKAQRVLCGLTVLSAVSFSGLVSASTVNIAVRGTISPVACLPVLTGGGIIDYGTIHPTTLHATDFTVLPELSVDLAITCDAPAKVALRSSNQRLGTMAGVTESGNGVAMMPVTVFGAADVGGVGLGLSGEKKVGGVAFTIDEASVLLDGAAGHVIGKTYGDPVWIDAPRHADLFDKQWTRMVSFADTGDTTPAEFTVATATVKAQAYLNKKSELDLTGPVALNGLVRLELVYL